MSRLESRARKFLEQIDSLARSSLSKELDRNYQVFHFSKQIIVNNLGLAESKSAEVLAAYWDFYKQYRVQASRLDSLLNEGLKEVLVFRARGARDFVLIAPTKAKISASLKTSTNHIAKTPGLEFLIGKEGKRSFDIARPQNDASTTPGEQLVSRAAAAFSGGSSAISMERLLKIKKKAEKAHKSTFTANLEATATINALKGRFEFSYTVPLDSKIRRALSAAEDVAYKDLEADILYIKDNKSIADLVDDILTDLIIGRPARTGTISKSVTKTKQLKSTKKNVSFSRTETLPFNLKFAESKAGSSTIPLLAIINSTLSSKIKENMGRPYLENQTGRFAESALVLKITETRDKALSIFYTYMKYPYQTFEPGYVQGDKGYDPRPLIEESIRDIAQNYVSVKFRSYRV